MKRKSKFQPGDSLRQKYRIDRLLGSGGFGEVYEAFDMDMQRKVAVKHVFRQLSIEHIKNEVLTLARHAEALRFMPDVYEHWEGVPHGDGYYIVMAFVEGETVDNIRALPWSSDDVVRFVRILLQNLRDLHRRGVVHCDIKPQNIKESPPSDLTYHIPYRILDFGIAKQGNAADIGGRSEYYAASEQYSDDPQMEIDHRVDIYGLAATAYYLLTNTPPIDAQLRYNAIQSHQPDPLPAPHTLVSVVSSALEQTLLEMMQVDREQRPSSAEAALSLLERRFAAQAASEPDITPNGLQIPLPQPAEEARPVFPAAAGAPATRLTNIPQFPLPSADVSGYDTGANHVDRVAAVQLDSYGQGVLTSIAWSPDGRVLMLGSSIGVYQYDVQSATMEHWFPTETPVQYVGYACNGQALVVVCNHTIRVLSVVPGPSPKHVPHALSGSYTQIIAAAQGQQIAVVADQMLRVYQLASGAEIMRRPLAESHLQHTIALSADGQTVALVDANHLHIWTIHTDLRTRHRSIGDVPQPLMGVFLAHAGDVVAAASPTDVVVWQRGVQVWRTCMNEEMIGIALSNNGQTLAIATPTQILLYRVRDGTLAQSFLTTPGADMQQLAFSVDNRLLAAASAEALCIWRLRDGELRANIDDVGSRVQSLALLPNSDSIAALSQTLHIWRPSDNALVAERVLGTCGKHPLAVATHPDGFHLASADDECIQIWHMHAGVQQRWRVHDIQEHGLSFSADGMRLLLVSNATIDVYDWQHAIVLRQIPLAEVSSIDHVGLAAAGISYVLHSAGRVMVRSLETNDDMHTLQPFPDDEITAVALSADGACLAVSTTTTLAVWHLDEDVIHLIGQQALYEQASVHRLVFAPDGATLAALHHTTVHLWHVTNVELSHAAVIRGHTDRVNDVAYMPQQSCIMTASEDGTLRRWQIPLA